MLLSLYSLSFNLWIVFFISAVTVFSSITRTKHSVTSSTGLMFPVFFLDPWRYLSVLNVKFLFQPLSIHSVTLVRFTFLLFKVLTLLNYYYFFPLWVLIPLGILCYLGLVIWVWEQGKNLKSQFALSPRRFGFGVSVGSQDRGAPDLQYKLHKSAFPLFLLWRAFLLEKPL